MRNRSSIFNFKRRDPVTAVLIFIALVIVVETLLALLPQNKLVREFRAQVVPAKSPDWQIMGDSAAQSGIIATQLAESLPPNQFVYNVALAGTGPEFPYFILKRQIAAGKAPKAVIYAPSPHTLASKRVPVLVGGFCCWGEILEIAKTRLEPCDVVYGILCKMSYSLRYREQLAGLLKGRPPSGTDNPDAPADALPTASKPTKHYTVEKLHPMYKKPFEVREFNRVLLEKFLHLANEHDIPVYWVTMPVIPAVYESRKRFNFEGAYYGFLADLQQRYGIRFLHKEFTILDDDSFKDSTHLNQPAARQFSKLLGKELAECAKPNHSQPPPATSP